MSNLIKKENAFLSKLFDNLNARFYGGELPAVVLTVQGEKAGAKNSLGWFSPNRWGEGLHEINMTAENFKREPFSIIVTLHHEMIHLFNNVKGVKDCTRQGRYHNKQFASACQSHGLLAIPDEKNGYITPHEEANQSKEMQLFFNEIKQADGWADVIGSLFQIQRQANTPKPKKEKATKWLDLTCLSCGDDFKVLKEKAQNFAGLFCPYCNEIHYTIEENEGGENENEAGEN